MLFGMSGKRIAEGLLAMLLAAAVALTGATAFAFAAGKAPAEQTLMVKNGATVNRDYLQDHGLAVDDAFHVVLEGSAIFEDVSINSEEASAVLVTDPETMILLRGATSFVGAENCAGIEVPQGKKVTIKGKQEGTSIIAVGNHGIDYNTRARAAANKESAGAGIGGTKDNPACGQITIKDVDGKLSVRGCGVGAAGIGSVRADKGDIVIKSCNLQGIYGGCQVSENEKAVLDGGPAIGGGTEDEPGGSISLMYCTGTDVVGGSKASSVGYGAVELTETAVAFGLDGKEDVEVADIVDIADQETAMSAAPKVFGAGEGQDANTGNVGGEGEAVDSGVSGVVDGGEEGPGDGGQASPDDVEESESTADDEGDAEEELVEPASQTDETLVFAGLVSVVVIAVAVAVGAVVAYRRGRAKSARAQ